MRTYETITELREHLERVLEATCDRGEYNQGFINGLGLYIDELKAFESNADTHCPTQNVLPQSVDCIDRQAAIKEATSEGAYGYISAEELAKMPPVQPMELKSKGNKITYCFASVRTAKTPQKKSACDQTNYKGETNMDEFEIYLQDLKPEVQKAFIEFYGDDGNFDVFPIATIEKCEDDDD